MLQSSFFDPVLGLDMHIVMVPSPAGPVPTPVPMPFVGMVFDPVGLAVGAAIGAALGGGPGIVLVNSMPVTNCGTEVTNKLTMPHLPAPGVAFAKGLPGNDAELYFGSLNVTLGGSCGVRLGDIALSCSDPVRLPTSVVLAIPKGMPVLNMPAMVPDLAAIAMAIGMRAAFRVLARLVRGGARLFRALRQAQRRSRFWRRAADRVHRAVDNHFPPSLRARMHRGACFLTGHPVDVATGRVLTDAVDLELPGPLPMRFSRGYDSSLSWRGGPLGRGWHHSFDQAVWRSRDKVYVRAEDGRQLEFSTRDLPEGTIRAGVRVFDPLTRLELRALEHGCWELHSADDRTVRAFAPLPADPGVARLVAIRTADRNHHIECRYDRAERLATVTDKGGRVIRFGYDHAGRLTGISLPSASSDKSTPHRTFEYDEHGQLRTAVDALGHATRYEYCDGLLVRETNRNGVEFFFQYDGIGWAARCVRTWGSGGVQDREIAYDVRNRKTFVTDGRGETTVYSMDQVGHVVGIMLPDGGEVAFEYDGNCGKPTLECNQLGAVRTSKYDARGNRVEFTAADGATHRLAYDENDRLVKVVDPLAGARTWTRDRDGHPTSESLPNGEVRTFTWARGQLAAFTDFVGATTRLEYDERGSPRSVRFPNGAELQYRTDSAGRVVECSAAGGSTRRTHYDAEGRPVRVSGPGPTWREIVRDPEGAVVEIRNATRNVRLIRDALGHIVRREEGGIAMRFEYDVEGNLLAAIDADEQRHEYERDGVGRVVCERGFDGVVRRYRRDVGGRVVERRTPTTTTRFDYDAADRLILAEHDDGTWARYAYRVDGLVSTAENESVTVEFERDALGRVVREAIGDISVLSRFDANGRRVELSTSLGAKAQMRRDDIGAVTELRLGQRAGSSTASVRFERTPDGRERSRHFANGVEVQWDRDGGGRPVRRRTFARASMVATLAAGLASAGTASASHLADDVVYTWRGEDQLAAIGRVGAPLRELQHDAAGRLVGEQRGDTRIDRALDATGNLFASSRATDRTFAAGGRLVRDVGTTFSYDEGGRRVATVEPDGRTTYAWNGHGLLAQVVRVDGSRSAFEYDAFARRVRKTEADAQGDPGGDVRYAWDRGQMIHELTGDGELTTWYWEPDTLAPIVRERAGRHWAIAVDHLGTPTEMYDADGALVWQMELDARDAPNIVHGSASDCPWRRPGQYHDVELGLCYQRWRYFDSRGCFMSPDPSGLVGGFNPMAYSADPMVRIDPLGLADGFIFRGVHAEHPAIEDARAGSAVPAIADSAVSATDHNIGGVSGSSPFTSWTHDPSVALSNAEKSGAGGVILVVPVGAPPEGATWRWEFSDDAYCESEVLLHGRRDGCEVLTPEEFRRRFGGGGCG